MAVLALLQESTVMVFSDRIFVCVMTR